MSFLCCKLCGEKYYLIYPSSMHFPSEDIVFSQLTELLATLSSRYVKRTVYYNRKSIYKLLREHGNVYDYDIDWQDFDFKLQTQALLKSQRSYKLSEARMLLLNSDEIGLRKPMLLATVSSVLKHGKR